MPLHYSVMIMTDGRDPFAAASSPFGQGACKLFQTNRPSPKSKILYLLRRIAIHLDFQTSSAATIPPTNNKIDELKGEENTHLIFQCQRQFQTSKKWTFSEQHVFIFRRHKSFSSIFTTCIFKRRPKSKNGESAECLTCTNSHFGRKHW